MKIIAAIIGVVVIAVGGLLLFLFQDPTTHLVDASGKELTAGIGGPQAGVEEPLFEEARALIEAQDFSAAEALLLRALEETGNDGEACILLAEVARGLDEPDRAADFALKAVELLPESAAAHLAYAEAIGAQMMGGGGGLAAMASVVPRIKRMKEECQLVVQLDPDDTEARTILAMTCLMLPKFLGGDPERSIELCREIEERDSVGGKKLLALAFHQTGEKERARDLCRQAIEEFPEEKGFLVTLGGFHAEEKHFTEADAAYEAARDGELNEDYYLSLYMQARMRIENEFEAARALELLAEFIEAEPEGDFVPAVSHALWRKGLAHELNGNPSAAKQAFEASLQLEPGFERATDALEKLGTQ